MADLRRENENKNEELSWVTSEFERLQQKLSGGATKVARTREENMNLVKELKSATHELSSVTDRYHRTTEDFS
jgi:hypothetical protein